MICDNCAGLGHILVPVLQATGETEYVAKDCSECLGVGEVEAETTPKYPGTKGKDAKYDNE